jgi:hypothetical protein
VSSAPPRSSLVGFAFLLLAGGGLALAAAGDRPCADLPPEHGPLGFQRRSNGDRCEGFFKSNVSGEALSVAFLMAGQLPEASFVEVAGAGPDREINVRAVALPLGTYYRMDAVVTPGKPLRWPLSEVVTASRSLKNTDLGLYGWFGDPGRPIYVPVRATALGESSNTARAVRLGVRANVRLALVSYSISDDERCHFGGQDWKRLAAEVGSGAVRVLELSADRPALCVGFRARLADSDQSEPLTVRINLR